MIKTEFKKLGSVSLREQALGAIRSKIVLGELIPGHVYSAPSLASQMGVSPTPVREAFLDLVKEGLIEQVRNKGFRVIELSDQDLNEIFQLRLLLEAPPFRNIAGHLNEDVMSQLTVDLETMEKCLESGDLTAYLETDRRFHLTLLEQFGNHRLVEIVDRFREQTRLYGLGKLVQSGNMVETNNEHRKIFQAVVDGDGVLAERLMKRHLGHTRGMWAGLPERSDPDLA